MSIVSETGQGKSITEVSRALKLFTDRESLINLFVSYVNDDPPQKRILFFYGDGGNGKSLLFRYLREYYCKRFTRENWDWLKNEFADDERIEQIKNATEDLLPLPVAGIDFGLKATNDDRPQETFSGLLILRRQLAANRIRFPLFDFACIWYLHKTKQLSQQKLKTLFPAEEMDFIFQIVDVASSTSYGAIAKGVLGIFGKHIEGNFTLWLQKRGLNESKIIEIQQKDAETELLKDLPLFFAQDLNSAMEQANAPERVILFFDTHESFWDFQRDMPRETYFLRDEWFRQLLSEIELSSGIIAVVAGRERPRWAEASSPKIEEKYLDAHQVQHLSSTDADKFLREAEANDGEVQQSLANYTKPEKDDLRRSLIAYAEVESNQIHPLYLGLLIDIVLAAARRQETITADDFHQQPDRSLKEKELVDRFLRYIDEEARHAVVALSACRAFNREIFVELGKPENLNFYSTTTAFETLQGFSFVWQAEGRGTNWFRIHELLRRLFAEHDRPKIKAAHHVLEQFYRQQNANGNELAIVEAIYHANKLDWKRGVDDWAELFQKRLSLNDYQICRALIDVRHEMSIKNDFLASLVLGLEGEFYLSLSAHSQAKQKLNEAIESFNKWLQLAPNDINAYNNKGIALHKRGELEAKLFRNDDALQSYTDAIASFDKVLELAPDDVYALTNKGAVLQSRGRLEAKLSKNEEALESYKASIASFDKALQIDPNCVAAYNNKGLSLQKRGVVKAVLSKTEDALQSFTDAIVTFDKVLEIFPDFVEAYNNKGITLRMQGDLEASLSRDKNALQSYTDSIDALDNALRIAPDFIRAHNSKGNVLRSRGELEVKLLRNEDALNSYQASVISYDNVLKLAPDDVIAHNNKGIALLSLGDVEVLFERNEDALKSYEASIISNDNVLQLAPNDVYALNNKATVLQKRGELEVALLRDEDALQSYSDSIAIFDKALEIAPNDVYAYNNKGLAFQICAELEVKLSRNDVALQSFTDAIVAFDKALKLAPDDVYALNNKGNVLKKRGSLRISLGQIDEACQDWTAALQEYSRSLELAPNDVRIQNASQAVQNFINQYCYGKEL